MEKGKQRRVFSVELKLDLVKKIEQGDLRVLDVTYSGTKKYEQKEQRTARSDQET